MGIRRISRGTSPPFLPTLAEKLSTEKHLPKIDPRHASRTQFHAVCELKTRYSVHYKADVVFRFLRCSV